MAGSCLAFPFFFAFSFNVYFCGSQRKPMCELVQIYGRHLLRCECSRPLSRLGLSVSWSCISTFNRSSISSSLFLHTCCLWLGGGPSSVYPPVASSPLRPPWVHLGICFSAARPHASTWSGPGDVAAVCPLLSLRHRYQCNTIPRSGQKPPNGPGGNEVAHHHSADTSPLSRSSTALAPRGTVICLVTTTASVTCHCYQARRSFVAPESWE